LKKNCVSSFEPVLSYFYNTYIGDLKPNGKSRKGRYTIESWNVHERVLSKRPRTKNNVENWHEKVNNKASKNLTLYKLVELLRGEQSKVEIELVKLNMGESNKRKKKQEKKDERLFLLCSNSKKEDISEFLNNISLNFELDKVQIKYTEEDNN